MAFAKSLTTATTTIIMTSSTSSQTKTLLVNVHDGVCKVFEDGNDDNDDIDNDFIDV